MAEMGAKMPWGVWLKVHTKAFCQALPVALLLVVEGKDLYYRATWQVTEIHPSKFETGDVVALCNRWYTLPTWGHKLYSLLSKALLKSCWDDVGVIVVKDGKPHLLFCEFDGAKLLPLDEFLISRVPRGASVRKLDRDDSVPKLSPAIAEMFVEEVRKVPASPWYLFRASMRNGQEHKLYQTCCQINAQTLRIKQMIKRGVSREAIRDQQEILRNLHSMRDYVTDYVNYDGVFRLFNGSLVASFLATYGLLDREVPAPYRYVPQDFAHDPPFKSATVLEEPVVFYKN